MKEGRFQFGTPTLLDLGTFANSKTGACDRREKNGPGLRAQVIRVIRWRWVRIQLANMLFSIVTPTFKQPDWVRLCAASIADQFGVMFEHIIQDGGDGQALEWLESMPMARLFVEPDRGMYDALTKGISKANGDIIVI